MQKQSTSNIQNVPVNNLSSLRAHWVNRDTILWNTVNSPEYSYSLFSFQEIPALGKEVNPRKIIEIPLEYYPNGMGEPVRNKFPHLSTYMTFKIPRKNLAKLEQILKGEYGVAARDNYGNFADVCGIQIPGVLDDIYSYSGSLGLVFSDDIPQISLWAPTARKVTLYVYENSTTFISKKLPMDWNSKTGVWSIEGNAAWNECFYLFEVEVYVPSTGKFEKSLVTDPYSLSLSTNSQRSQIVNLKSQSLKPEGWELIQKPVIPAPEDIVIYELHVRDFSIYDDMVPNDFKGTFKAFTQKNSNGMKHLQGLAESGLTHLHLLPVFDIATINEDKSKWKDVDFALLSQYPADSDYQQNAVNVIKDLDGFNWGYDPYHFTCPEGSYSTDPNGTPRIIEFREMVLALSQIGLSVIMDVVYNHTFASGMDSKSVLDKIVPGYYHRLDSEGRVEQSTCCANTASEHTMMRKLIIDSLTTWAVEYRVDGFRFDLMGHHMLEDMRLIRAALDELSAEKNGVDGKSIYIYGEGWNFGEVANNARGVNAAQQNIGGTGIGVFNDRLRDAVRGGSHFGYIFEQGFATGMYYQPNSSERRGSEFQKWRLFDYTDWIRASLAGNIASYQLVRGNGERIFADQLYFNGSPAAYNQDPHENIVYVAAHDNETLWDIIQIKSAYDLNLSDRVRMNNLSLSLAAFSQGIPFFHAGDDLLRSKSLDRNSYNSSDWFNKIDWTYNTNNWGVGLPIDGRENWDYFRSILNDPSKAASFSEISFSAGVFREYLRIRKSSILFRLRTAEDVKKCVNFLNTGPDQIPGFIVLQLTDNINIDPHFKSVIVFFNASPGKIYFQEKTLLGLKYELHPVQAGSVDITIQRSDFDTAKGLFTIPGRSTAVFVERK
ncbi:MAG: pullulanase-type alpha-1,6-glucosidase [Chloroflexota bacterium]